MAKSDTNGRIFLSEDYVSYEVAKLLKEKGFDVPCLAHWYIGSEAHERFSDYPFNWNEVKSDLDWLSRPTHQMAMKWLREVHLLHIYAEYKAFFQEKPKKLYYHWMPFIKPLPKCKYQTPQNKVYFELDEYCNSYEEAVEAALKYCLEKLI